MVNNNNEVKKLTAKDLKTIKLSGVCIVVVSMIITCVLAFSGQVVPGLILKLMAVGIIATLIGAYMEIAKRKSHV